MLKPGEVAGSLHYQETVRDLAREGGDWRYYNENFQKHRQGGQVPWDTHCAELWNKAMSRSRNTGRKNVRRDIELVRGQQYMIRLTIRRYKHDQGKGPHELFSQIKGEQQGPLFGWVTMGVQQITFPSWLKACVSLCRLDPTRYKGHSSHIGVASSAAAQGCTESQIEALGSLECRCLQKVHKTNIHLS